MEKSADMPPASGGKRFTSPAGAVELGSGLSTGTTAWSEELLASLPAAVVGLRSDGRVAYWNAAAEAVFGWTA